MGIETVSGVEDPRLADYALARDPVELRRRGTLLAESREVVAALIRSRRWRVRSVLATKSALAALVPELALLEDSVPVYEGEPDLMTGVVGYTVHRGCLAAADRGEPETLAGLLSSLAGGQKAAAGASGPRLVALEAVSNPDNVGGIFRNSLAFGAGGVILGPGCGDPLYRKAIRTSMAASLRVPFAPVPDLPEALRTLRSRGFFVVALSSRETAVDLRRLAAEAAAGKVVLVAGSEGVGLSLAVLEAADAAARIPMAPGVDSLNVSTATGIALHELFRPPA
ncbi:MAG: RNA methyltransferase [Elusimicrobia bacterium]|nr:RNA methyltransferase [Elusimicrobiota bacterium]